MDRNNRVSPVPVPKRTDESSKDYPALCVFVGLVIALFVTGYFALKNVDTDVGFRPGPVCPGVDKRY